MHNEYTSAVGDGSDPEDTAVNGGVTIQRYAPNLVDSEHVDANNFLCANVIEYGSSMVIITGNNPAARLLEIPMGSGFRQAVAGATVLLDSHHGRDVEYCADFVSVVNPRLTV